jgi:nucleotide-binding universal stress UspA family protein
MNKGTTFQTILVGVDGTPEAEHAAAVATSLANNLRARMILLGVLAPLSPETQAEGVGLEKAADERLRMEEQLQNVLTAARGCGIDVVAEIAEGDPEKEIERRAEHGFVDLIVVGHRDISRVRRWLEGSTSETLVRSCPVAVLVIPDGKPRQ